MLCDIEMDIEEYMKALDNIFDIDPKEINVEERIRKGEHKKEQREKILAKEKDQQEKKNAELKARMDRVYQKLGRNAMPRSMKKKVKKEKTKVVENEDIID